MSPTHIIELAHNGNMTKRRMVGWKRKEDKKIRREKGLKKEGGEEKGGRGRVW